MSISPEPTYPPHITLDAHRWIAVPPDGYIRFNAGAVVPVQVVGGDAFYPAGCVRCTRCQGVHSVGHAHVCPPVVGVRR